MNLEDVKSTVLGRIAWLPRRGVGSFITIEFGCPMLITREPIDRPGVHPRLTRRNVFVQGEQHIWIQADDWSLRSEAGTLSSRDDPLTISQGLQILAGQKLVGIEATMDGSEFKFEYGETLSVRPDQNPEETQWSIFWHTGGNASWLSRGELILEAAKTP